MKPQAETKVVVETNICPRTSAMQARTQDATPEPAKQTGCQRAPGKVQLRLDLIQRAPCFTMQPTRISRQNQTGLRGQSPYRARRHHCGCNFDSAMVTLPNICNHYATAMQASATAVRSKQRCSRRCSSKRCNRRQKPQRHTTASRCQSKRRSFNVSFRNSDGTKHTDAGATQVQRHCNASSMATPPQTQVQCRCKHKRNKIANVMATCRYIQTCTHPMQTQTQT